MATITTSYMFTGANQTFVVPPFVTSINIKAWGAGGGTRFTAGGFGGPGGYSTGTLPVVTGDVLTIITGQGGSVTTIPSYGGGGAGGTDTFAGIIGGSGGGRSAVRKNGTEVITAAGGGGGGSSSSSPTFSNGGSGGGLTGTDAFVNASGTSNGGGKGGTQTAGGAGGVNPAGAFSDGLPGSAFQGGNGGPSGAGNSGGGGGGGGGFFGGGGGIGQLNTLAPGFQDLAGGGGSSFIGGVNSGSTLNTPQNTSTSSSSTNLRPPNQTDPNYIAGVGLGAASSNGGNGLVVITYEQTTLIPTKQVNTTLTDINTTLIYTITLNNTNTNTIGNVLFIDTIPNGTTFVSNSLTLNGTPTSNNPNPPGFTIGTLLPGLNTITFNVLVGNTVPNPNPIPNSCNVSATVGFSANSNIVNTFISNATISASKVVSKSFATVGDVLTYTIALTNNGSVTANNVLFVDTIPSGTSLVSNSFKQDGTGITGSSNPPGVTLPNNIGPGKTSTVTFQVTINTIPNPNPIPNNATVSFNYTVDPSLPNAKSGNINTNTVTTQVNLANLVSVTKGVDKSYGIVGDILTYTITIPNTGNVSANNVTFLDTIPSGTTFIANSVFINGDQQNGAVVAPPTGLNIGTIGPNSTTTLSFKVTVATIPTPNPIPNSSNVNYSYILNTVSGATVAGSNNSNIVTTTINDAIITSTKSVSPTNVLVGDTVDYTVVLANSGNATANNVVFIDTIPSGTSFVSDSLKLNGATQTGQSPAPPGGFGVGSIVPGGLATITFKVTVTTIPSTNPFPNSSTTNYNFVLNGTTGETLSKGSNSNTVTVFVNPNINPLKVVDKQFATLKDTLTYTIIWQNLLAVPQTNVFIIDTIPNDTTFVANSINLNGTTVSGATINPPNGLSIGTIPVGGITTVSFKVSVDTLPSPNPIPNQALAQFSYIIDPTLSVVTTETASSNIVTTQINYASIPSATKSVSENFGIVGDILTYTISFTNTGNTTATNVALIDTIPNGTTFNINSVFVNGTNQPGAVVAPPTGLNIGDIAVNSTTTVVFDVTVNTVPSPNPIPNNANVSYKYVIDPVAVTNISAGVNTNTVNTTINFANLGIIGKTVDKAFANVNDTITYIITIQNTGNTTANGVVISDTIPNDTSFVTSSVIVNGTQNTTTLPVGNILAISMGNVAPGAVASLSFKVKVTSIPNPNPIPNSATSNYTYTVNPSTPNGQSGSNNTNIVNTQVGSANLSGITKFVDKTFVTCGDIITYTISIPNTGNITATNVVLTDTVPSGTVFVPSSILVNGATSSATSPMNISLGSISPGGTTTVSFSVKVQC